MLAASVARIESLLDDGDLVLDVGGWANPYPRADWVIDLMPHATRGLYGPAASEPERFSAETWVERDICDRRPWPFADGQFRFAVCSHTLEDVRDPVWVCSELARVARAGYVEVPSRLEEQSQGLHGPWVGWSHHRWLVEVTPAGLEFVFKSAVLHGRPELCLPAALAETLTDEERVQALFWEGRLEAWERVLLDPAEHDRYLLEGVAETRPRLEARLGQPSRRRFVSRVAHRLRRAWDRQR